ncbi:MAG: SMC-Scp complex subunit ScpB [bacterium]
MDKIAILEGILFVVGDEGITLSKVSEILSVDIEEAKDLLKKLKEECDKESRGIRVSFLGDTFKLTTKKEYSQYYQKLIENSKTDTLSAAALETLAIIAYNEPITKFEINEIRGIESAHIIKRLLAKDLIKVSGKSSLPGQPNLYKTTSDFLDYFGLSSLKDLPEIKEEKEDENEKELFTSIYKENMEED